jgi:hypothetical protein
LGVALRRAGVVMGVCAPCLAQNHEGCFGCGRCGCLRSAQAVEHQVVRPEKVTLDDVVSRVEDTWTA